MVTGRAQEASPWACDYRETVEEDLTTLGMQLPLEAYRTGENTTAGGLVVLKQGVGIPLVVLERAGRKGYGFPMPAVFRLTIFPPTNRRAKAH